MNGSSHTEPPSRAGSSTGSSADTKPKKRRESFDGLDDKEELRILNIETALKERRDVRGSVSAVQLVKLAQFQRTQERIQRMKKIKWYIIDPHSTAMQVWDAATALSLIFTAIATPIEVAFIPAPKCGLETLYIINRTVDAIFMVDMTLQFFLSHPVKANVWEVRMHVIAKRYLRGWFFLDVISLFPSFFEYPAMWADCNAPPPVRARTSAAATRTSSAHVSLHFSHLFLILCCPLLLSGQIERPDGEPTRDPRLPLNQARAAPTLTLGSSEAVSHPHRHAACDGDDLQPALGMLLRLASLRVPPWHDRDVRRVAACDVVGHARILQAGRRRSEWLPVRGP